MSIEIDGLNGVIVNLEELMSTEQMQAALGMACALVERSAKMKAPKGKEGDGHLRRSIESRVEQLSGIVFTTLEYAPYVEYGTGIFAEVQGRQDVPWIYRDEKGEFHKTSGIKPHPYMRPALNENREEIKRILAKGLINND